MRVEFSHHDGLGCKMANDRNWCHNWKKLCFYKLKFTKWWVLI